MKILMVCLGNICRSPLAEGLLQNKARKAGLNWTGYHEVYGMISAACDRIIEKYGQQHTKTH